MENASLTQASGHGTDGQKPIPVIGFSAYSGTGKTTLIEKLIILLKSQGLQLAVIKHDAHDFEIDHENKDSWRFTRAGADITLISSPTKTVLIEQRGRSLQHNLSMIQGVDLIIVEGYKQEPIPRIGIARKATGKGLPGPMENYIAVVTDDDRLTENIKLPLFHLDDIGALADFIYSAILHPKKN